MLIGSVNGKSPGCLGVKRGEVRSIADNLLNTSKKSD
jgi:hypothetical protein